jgi:hypothetical protein
MIRRSDRRSTGLAWVWLHPPDGSSRLCDVPATPWAGGGPSTAHISICMTQKLLYLLKAHPGTFSQAHSTKPVKFGQYCWCCRKDDLAAIYNTLSIYKLFLY